MAQDALAVAQQALGRAEWEEARRGFEAALTAEESPEALEGLAMAAWWLEDSVTVLATRLRAFQLFRQRGDLRSAGRVALALAQDHIYFCGEVAVGAGWYRRARRLLSSLETTPEHGWLELGLGDLALSIDHDLASARERARNAAEIGRQLGVVDLEMMGLALEGLAMVYEGRLAEGMPRLDEAITAAVAGEMEDYYAIGFAYCCLVQACVVVRDYERATQWCVRAKAYSSEVGFRMLSSLCGTQYASVLTWRGAWKEAEAELEAAARHLFAIWPPLQGEATVRLAQLRRLQGRLEEAEALLASTEDHPLALVEASAQALERDDPASAVKLAERFLRQTHADDLSMRTFGLEALFAARLACGNLPGAGDTLDQLRAATETLSTAPVRAAARLAEGLLLAEARSGEGARAALEDAAALFRRTGSPFEAARARLALARLLFAEGDRPAAGREARSAAEAFLALGARSEARRAQALLQEISTPETAVAGGPAGGLTRRELDVLRRVAVGGSNSQIAADLGVSELTVKRHVSNILTKLDLPNRAAAAAYAVRHQIA
jgi:LuxR family transcriptional regulator, maltose regulon positive regulatory protein